MEPVFRSDIKVDLVGHWGTDLDIARAAWASSGKDEEAPSDRRIRGLINSLLRDRHGTPVDEGFLSVYVEAPRAVRDEWTRHRNLSYSSSSLRYTLSNSEFYIPPRDRALRKVEGFKQIQPRYEPYSDEEYDLYASQLRLMYRTNALARYSLIADGFAETEAQRWITFDGEYVRFRARGMLRPWLQFLQLRTHDERANHVSWPMHEIEQAARQVEEIIAKYWPITYELWVANGRDI